MYKRVFIIALTVTALSACDELIGPDQQDGLTPEEVAELSNALIQDGMAETGDTTTTSSGLASSQYGGMGSDTSTIEFTRTHDCSLGGQVSMTGTRVRAVDWDTRTGSMDFTATRTFTDCARPLADSTVTITLNGDVDMTARREWEGGMWNGTQELTIVGTIDWATDDDRSGTCEIDIQASYDASTQTREVTGEACAEDIGVFRGWSFGPMGNGPGSGGHGPHHGGGTGG